MHIAICDDNVADRKQLERLLSRESDKRKEQSGVFYTDSFGEGAMLYPKRKSYDLIFIDLVEENENGLDFALDLCAEGVTCPIVLCSSRHDYAHKAEELINYPSNLLFLNKPIIKAELSAVLDKAVELEKDQPPTIEIRHKSETYYVFEDDIVYVKAEKLYVNVFLKDGTEVPVYDTLWNFYSSLRDFTHFAFINNFTVINAVYVEKNSPFKVTLKSGLSFPLTALGRRSLRIAAENIRKENEEKI
ncbi:MAG: response regulator [Lachnospiraceae bacterium]|nr:response regulator [Lachnospiraceae bacterium]